MNELLTVEYSIRSMNLDDIDHVVELGNECRMSGWKHIDYQNQLMGNSSISFVAEKLNDKDQKQKLIVGFLLGRLILPEAEILNIAVSEHFRRKQIGSALIDKLLTEAVNMCVESIWLEVRASNISAIELYLKKGFYKAGKRYAYYKQPSEDAIIMSRKCI